MITWTDLNNALGTIVSQTLTEIGLPSERDRQDITKPVARRSYRIDLTATDGMGTDDYAETGVDAVSYTHLAGRSSCPPSARRRRRRGAARRPSGCSAGCGSISGSRRTRSAGSR